MKIGIITITDNNNYGNRLQCYALFKTIKSLGYNVVEIRNDNKSIELKVKRILKKIIKISGLKSYKKRKAFKKFNKMINRTKYIIDYNKPKEREKIDIYIVGSDQVWNPKYERLSNLDILNFETNAKKISYAASFGINILPEESTERLKYIEKFNYISTREETGRSILKKHANIKNIYVNIDPTLLLPKCEWKKISQQSKYRFKEKYIFLYFLGGIDTEKYKEIKKFALKEKCEIINILDKKCSYYDSGPSEFISLIENAYTVFTDSFHASVFAFIFNKPFVIFDRKEAQTTSSRLNNLISTFKLENRKYNEKEITKENISHNYQEGYKILRNKQKEALKYLKKSIIE